MRNTYFELNRIIQKQKRLVVVFIAFAGVVTRTFGNDASLPPTIIGFTISNNQAVPRGVITQMTGFPALVNGVIVPFGTFTFTRLD